MVESQKVLYKIWRGLMMPPLLKMINPNEQSNVGQLDFSEPKFVFAKFWEIHEKSKWMG